jgi:DNA-binding MarR family transcriptional regulator
MSNLLIQIPVNDKAKFKVYTALLNNFIGVLEEDKFKLDPLTPRELEVMALLIYYNKLYLSLPEAARQKYLHSSDIRQEIRKEIDIDSNNYNNILGRLSKKILVFNKQPLYDNGKINAALSTDISTYEGIEFRFKETV